MTTEISLLYSLFTNHPADGRELANIGKRGVHAVDVSTGRGRWLARLARRPRPAGAAARA